MRKPRRWKMFALRGPRADEWAFDVYHSRREARRVMSPGERIITVEVREILPKRRSRK